MSLTDDARLVVDDFAKFVDGLSYYAPNPEAVKASVRLATAYIELSADLAEHKRRLSEQSAVLNSARQSRDEYKRRLLNLPERSDNDDTTDDC